MIRFACPGCQATYSVPDEKAGKNGRCPKCQAQFVIPSPEPSAAPPPPASFPAPPPPPPRPAPAPASDEVEIAPCPGCQARLMVSSGDVGADVECPYCKTVYTAALPGAAPPAPVRRRRDPVPVDEDDDRPSRRRREPAAEDDDRPARRRRDEDEDDDRSSRRSRRRDEDDEDEDDRPRGRRRGGRRATALAVVSAPGVALIVIGGLGILMGVLNIGNTALNPNQNPLAGPAGNASKIGQYVGAFVSLIWGITVLLGGIKMRSLTNRGSAMTGAIVSMVPCNPCCLIGLPVGIWALVTLTRDDVKRAFK